MRDCDFVRAIVRLRVDPDGLAGGLIGIIGDNFGYEWTLQCVSTAAQARSSHGVQNTCSEWGKLRVVIAILGPSCLLLGLLFFQAYLEPVQERAQH